MLQDPENYEEWEFEVRAENLEKARVKCERIAANNPLTEVISVSQATTTPYKGTYRFVCWFRSEAIGHDNDSDTGN